jgi:hypothetical protein
VQAWLGAPISRISPLLNAVDIDQYPINTAARPARPTTVMLSHVYPLKDIVSAIRAAAIIVHRYHVTGEILFTALAPRRAVLLTADLLSLSGVTQILPCRM